MSFLISMNHDFDAYLDTLITGNLLTGASYKM